MKIRCPSCRREIPNDEPLKIRGVADVEGTASLEEFFEHGIFWEAHDSCNEKAECPFCRNWLTLKGYFAKS